MFAFRVSLTALCFTMTLALVWYLSIFLAGTAFLAFYTPGPSQHQLDNATVLLLSALAIYCGARVARQVWRRVNP